MITSPFVYLIEKPKTAMGRVGETSISIRNSAFIPGSVLRVAMTARGSALLLVLFAIVLLSGLIITTVGFVKNDIDEYAARNKEFRSRQLAESGLAFGLNPQVQNEDRSLLEQRAPDGGMFRVAISSESTKLNINYLLRSNRDDILEKLFMRWGVASKLASEAVAGLHDYMTGPANSDEQTAQLQQQLQQAPPPQQQTPQQQTPQQQMADNSQQLMPVTRQFQAVEEMSLVPEFAPVMDKQPDWKNSFTIWGDGKIDVNLADADMIELIASVTHAQADQFVKYRWGPDGVPFTQDDRVYRTADEVRAGLGLSQAQFQLVQGLLSLNSAVDRIESTGIIAGYERKVVVVASRNSTPMRYLSWQER
jgi:general secretion pathway protein K